MKRQKKLSLPSPADCLGSSGWTNQSSHTWENLGESGLKKIKPPLHQLTAVN
ncbi:MAG: hypothetical protein IAE90_01340 [Ignavibacteria bacterium]|nr:hypothetical protein [Ignavibacteria bacterium]